MQEGVLHKCFAATGLAPGALTPGVPTPGAGAPRKVPSAQNVVVLGDGSVGACSVRMHGSKM